MGRLYSLADLKEHLRVSRSQTYEFIKEGLKPTHYFGKSPRWTEQAVADWLETKQAA